MKEPRNKDIELLRNLLRKRGRSDLAEKLRYSYSSIKESSTYGTYWNSVLSTFEIYSPLEIFEDLALMNDEDKDFILDTLKLIYPPKEDSYEFNYIAFYPDVRLDPLKIQQDEKKMSKSEMYKVINDCIGVDEGNLKGFSYSSLKEFYPYYCDIDINSLNYKGTKREAFIQILEESDSITQAKILKGLLKKFENDGFEIKGESYLYMSKLIKRLEGNIVIDAPLLKISTTTIDTALEDLKTLLKQRGAVSCIDRAHTVLHGFLKSICYSLDIEITEKMNIVDLFKNIRTNSATFSKPSSLQDETDKILRTLSNLVDSINTIRNKASMAHPNENLLNEEEAILVINSIHTILHYLNDKINYKE